MESGKEIKLFTGSMDGDSNPRNMKPEDYRYMLNKHNGITDKGNSGAAENVLGNIEIQNPELTGGTNKVIGSFEDVKGNSIIYAIYNSNGYHGWYRWYSNRPPYVNGVIETIYKVRYPQLYDEFNRNPLNFQEHHLITGVNLVDELLYYTDYYNNQCCINVVRANETNKRRKFNLYFNTTKAGARYYKIAVYKNGTAGTVIMTLAWNSIAGSSTNQRADDFIVACNTSADASQIFSVTSKIDYAHIEMVNTGGYYIDLQESDNATTGFARLSLVVPDNFYPDYDPTIPVSYSPASWEYFDRGKYPAFCNPKGTYKQDTSVEDNQVHNKVFQFRTKYIWKDFENSTYSAISIIPITVYDTNNYIDVDFTDARLQDERAFAIRQVVLCVSSDGGQNWNEFKTLEPYQFAGAGMQTYKFFNDTVYIPVAQSAAIVPYSNIPILSKSQEFVDGHVFDGGLVLGYDKPKIDIDFEVSYNQEVRAKRYTIRGVIFIRAVNKFLSGVATSRMDRLTQHQPIHRYGTYPTLQRAFGGLNENVLAATMATNYGQNIVGTTDATIPQVAGFPVYLAGTHYYGVSQQYKLPGTGSIYDGIRDVQNADGTYDATAFNNKWVIDAAATDDGTSHSPFAQYGVAGYGEDPNFAGTLLYSTFEITGVPEGEYIVRIANPNVTYAELNGLGISDDDLSWQKKSTNVLKIGGVADTEIRIVLNDANTINGVYYLDRTEIADLCSDGSIGASVCPAISGYFVDHDLSSSAVYSEMLDDTRIEKALVALDHNYSPQQTQYTTGSYLYTYYGQYGSLTSQPSWTTGQEYTDHNGYWFYTPGQLAAATVVDYTSFTSGMQVATLVISPDSNGGVWGGNNTSTLIYAGFRNTQNIISTNNRTKITGEMKNLTGDLISNIPVIVTHSTAGVTDIFGNFSIYCYAKGGTGSRIGEYIVASSQGVDNDFIFQTSSLAILSPLLISGASYNSTTLYDVGDLLWVVASLKRFTESAFHRGYKGDIGVVYYDNLDRCCGVCTVETGKLNILYYTERNEAGSQVAPGSPNVKWSMYNEPPPYAVKYQFVRQKDQTVGIFLQWMANKVTFIDEAGTAVTQLDSTCKRVEISLSNLSYFSTFQEPNSVITFSFVSGDRIRLISDAAGILFLQYYDFEIVEVDTSKLTVYVNNDVTVNFQANMLLEVYSPKDKSDDDSYYEFGECYAIQTGVFNGVKKRYHTGTLQNQAYGTTATNIDIPAQGYFHSGDVYYRFRKIPLGYNDTPATPTVTSYKSIIIADQSVYDTVLSRYDGTGRPNTTSLPERTEHPTAIVFSDQYIAGTQINGLSMVQPLSFKQFATNYGLIYRLIVVNNDVLKLVFGNGFQVSIYVNQGIIRQATGSPLLELTDAVVSNTHLIQRTFGTKNPESVVLNDEGDTIGWDETEGVVWRSSGDGLIDISAYKQSTNFSNIAIERELLDRAISECPSVYDLFYDEYILTIGSLGAVPEKLPEATVDLFDLDQLSPVPFVNGGFTENPLINTVPNDPNATGFDTQNNGWFVSNYGYGSLAWYQTHNGVLHQNGVLLGTPPPNPLAILSQNIILKSVSGISILRVCVTLSGVSGNASQNWISLNILNNNTGASTTYNVAGNGTHCFDLTVNLLPLTAARYTIQLFVPYTFDGSINGVSLSSVINSAITKITGQANGNILFVITPFTPNFPDISQCIVDGVNANGLGMTATDSNGYVTIKAPVPYSQRGISIEVLYTDVNGPQQKYYSCMFSEGHEASNATPFAGRTISFTKRKNGWITYYSFTPEYYGRLRNQIVSFKDGRLWLHNKGAVYNNFYGTQYTSVARTVGVGGNPTKAKVVKGLWYKGRGKQSGVVSTPPFDGADTGMTTNINEDQFRLVEGAYYAAVGRDRNTPNAASPDMAQVNGREIRGETYEVELTDNSSEFNVLYLAEIQYFYSENS